MKNRFYKFLQIKTIAPLLLFLASTFASCFLIKVIINEPEEVFNYGKTPMYFIMAITVFSAIGFFAFTIYNFKKIAVQNKIYTPEEEEKLLQKEEGRNRKAFKLMVLLPILIMSFLSGGLIISLGVKAATEEISILIFIFLGVMLIFMGDRKSVV